MAEVEATEKATTSKSKASSTTSARPNTLDMIIEAIKDQNDRKGATIPGIKSYIIQNYTTVDPVFLKTHMKKALKKGLESELLVRPKGTEEAGASLSGRFRLNKAKIVSIEKAKLKTAKPKAAKSKETEKPKKRKPKTDDKEKKSKTDAKKTTSKTKTAADKKKKATKSPKKKLAYPETPKKAVKKSSKSPAAKKMVKKTPMKKQPMKSKSKK